MITGECNCGEVSFTLSCSPQDVIICHCSICRRFTGNNGIAVVVVDKTQFNWTKGLSNITVWTKPGHDWQSNFCKTCGSSVPGENDDSRMFVPAGALTTNIEDLKVTHHIWTGSKASWDEIADGGKQHNQEFTG